MTLTKELYKMEQISLLAAVDICKKDLEGFQAIINLHKYDQIKLQEKIEQTDKLIDEIEERKSNLEDWLETLADRKTKVENRIDEEDEDGK